MSAKYFLFSLLLQVITSQAQQTTGPLKLSTKTPSYVSDQNGKIVYLTGSHTWANMQEIQMKGAKSFDYEAYLDMMEQNGHNFMRMWMFEQPLMGSWS